MTGAHIFCIRFLKIPIYLSYKAEGASLSDGDFPKGIIWVSGLGRHCLTLNISSSLRTHDSAPLVGSGAQRVPCMDQGSPQRQERAVSPNSELGLLISLSISGGK